MIEANRRELLLALAGLAGAGILKFPTIAVAAEELVVTTYGGSWEKFWRASLLPAFAKQTGDMPKLDVALGRTITTNMRAAGIGHSPYGVVMTNEIYATVLRAEGHFEKLNLEKIPNYADLYPVATGTDGWAAVGLISPIGIGYRTDMVATPPKSWKDLWDNPEFKGKTGLYSIQNSAGKMMLMLASLIYGGDIHNIDAGFKKLAELGKVMQTDFNMSTMMSTGEVVVAPFDFGEIARLRNQGLPVDCVIPKEGLMMWDQTFNVAKGAAASDLAHSYIDFILSPQGQDLLMRSFFVSPVNRKVAIPADLRRDVPVSGSEMERFIKWDWDFMNKNADAISRRWNEIFGA
jgi:putative spermidine/putrescine transport system substrate-binding protein